MSDLFIQNEEIRSKIINQYLRDAKHVPHVDKSDDRESDSELSDGELETDREIVESFHFLDTNDGELEILFDVCDFETDITKHYTLYLCGYSINTTGDRPFLQYMMQLESGTYSFPKIKFHCPTNVQVSEEDADGKSPNHVYFENECTKYFLDMFEPESGLGEDELKKLYKGYAISQRLENCIYVVFDMSMFRIRPRENVRRHWATIDEIVNHKQMFGYTIDQDSTFLFYERPGLMHIKNQHGAILDIPSVLFLCRKTNSTYENIYSEYDERENEEAKYITLLDERSPHPVLGDFFVFSTSPLDFHSQSIIRIRRFAGFLERPLYITSGIYSPPVSDTDETMSLGKVIPSIVSYMNQPNERTNDDDETGSDQERQTHNNDVQEKIELSQIQEEIDALNTMDFGCAYFQEMVGESKQAFWCIKSESHFSEL